MKKLIFFLLIAAFVLTSTSLYAAQKAPLGFGNIAVKLNYISFTEDDDTGIYAGLEGYGEITPNLYLGAEVGYANSISEADIFVPIELNLKYAIKAAPDFVIDLGAGVSYNYVEDEVFSKSDWLFGIQFFVDSNYTIDKFFIGINAKYQLTEHFKDSNFDFNNWRIGGQIGIMF